MSPEASDKNVQLELAAAPTLSVWRARNLAADVVVP
jgi:hypothetical protein